MKIAPEVLILTIIGCIPFIGDVIKDQINANESRRESERLWSSIKRISERIGKIQPVPKSPEKQAILADFISDVFDKIRKQRHFEKLIIMSDIIADSVTKDIDLDRLEFVVNSIDSLSIDSLGILSQLYENGKNKSGAQIHWPSIGLINQLNSRYGYEYFVALLRELESIGVINLDIQFSSRHEGKPRFIIWWTDLANEFCLYASKAET
jgi:hypothetical protein